MEFPSLEWVKELQEKCNANAEFETATMWSDVRMVIAFGDKRYYLKLYKGKIIDVMEYLPMTNALGYDIIVSGAVDAWKKIIEDEKFVFWMAFNSGDILVDGNMLECNRMHEAINLIADIMPEVK